MSVFSDAELTYLAKGKLGRLATIDGAGMPHVVPLGWRYNPGLDVIDIGGRDFAPRRSDQLGDGVRRGIVRDPRLLGGEGRLPDCHQMKGMSLFVRCEYSA